MADDLAEASISGITWPQALHLAVLMLDGSLALSMVYCFSQFGQEIFIFLGFKVQRVQGSGFNLQRFWASPKGIQLRALSYDGTSRSHKQGFGFIYYSGGHKYVLILWCPRPYYHQTAGRSTIDCKAKKLVRLHQTMGNRMSRRNITTLPKVEMLL